VTKEIFEHEMGKANTFASLGERLCYWEGYQRGLRRAFYGDVFGSQEDHERWMTFADDDKANEFQRERGRGYVDGLAARASAPAAGATGIPLARGRPPIAGPFCPLLREVKR
jgi:hypothetical protein